VPGLKAPIFIAEDPVAASTGCTGLRLWSCALDLAALLVAEAAPLMEQHAVVVELG